jgi:acyl carrier protein
MSKGMPEQDIKTQVIQIVSDHFTLPPADIADGMGPGELPGWDSLGHLQLVRSLEQHFNLQFSVYDIMAFNSIQEISETIDQLLK